MSKNSARSAARSAQILLFPLSAFDEEAITIIQDITGWSRNEAIFFSVKIRQRNELKDDGRKNIILTCVEMGYHKDYFHDAIREAMNRDN